MTMAATATMRSSEKQQQVPGGYPDHFVKAVKAAYPDNMTIHERVDGGLLSLGNLLRTKIPKLNPNEVIFLIDSGKITKLRALATDVVHKQLLYVEWEDNYGNRRAL